MKLKCKMWTGLSLKSFLRDLYSILLEETSIHDFDPVSDFFIYLKDLQTLHVLKSLLHSTLVNQLGVFYYIVFIAMSEVNLTYSLTKFIELF